MSATADDVAAGAAGVEATAPSDVVGDAAGEAPPGRVVELPGPPALGGLYARGVGRSALAAARRDRTVRPTDLPTTRVRATGLRADADRLTAYQHLLGEPADDLLPAGFVHVLAFPVATALMVRDGFPLPLLGLVHLANTVTQRRAVRLGETLDVTVHAQNLRAHRSGVSVDVVAQVGAGADDAVWRGVSTYLAKGHRLAVSGGGRPEGADQEAWTPPTPTGLWRLPADEGRRYAAVSGDVNPIHTSPLAARAFGFPRAIAHGMDTAARALADVGRARGEAYTWSVEFARPVLLPSTTAVRVAPDDDGVWRFAAWSGRSGKRHLHGEVRPLG